MARVGKNLYERKDGRWEGRYISGRDENGKAKYSYVYGKTEHEVEAVLIEKKAEIKAAQREGIITFSDVVEEWIAERRKSIQEASVDRYEYLMKKYILPEFGERDYTTVKIIQLNTYIVDIGDKKKHGKSAIAGSTQQQLQSLSSQILAYAENRNKVFPNPYQMSKGQGRPYELLSSDEIRKLIACAKYNRCTEMLGVMLCLFTGIGTGEICGLSWDDFDLERREISITHTLYRLKNKDADKDEKRTKVTLTNVRKSAVRTVQYPQELSDYVAEFYSKGCVFLTCEKNKYEEQKTYVNHLDTAFRGRGLDDMTLVRVKKTYDAGLADVWYLTDPFYENTEGIKPQVQNKVDERWLIKEMVNDLLSLRSILGLSKREMGSVVALTEDEYDAVESGEAPMGWDMFMSFLFFFRYNSKTEKVVEALGLFPGALKENMMIVRE